MASKEEKTAKQVVALSYQPVELLDNAVSNVYTHLHAILVFGVIYANFTQIVEDPVTSLTYLLVPLAALQAIYVTICVPASSGNRNSSSSQTTSNSRALQAQRRKQKASSSGINIADKLVPAILSVLLSLFISAPVFFVILVLHGAPITTHIPHTALLAAHLSFLSCIPLFYAHGVDSTRWRSLYSLSAPVDELMGAAIGTMVGAWLGAIPIPLDWDREWQKWPVTVLVGAYAGWAAGRTLGGTRWVKGSVVEFD